MPLTNSHGTIPELEDDAARPYKAYVSAALSALATFLVYWIADPGKFTQEDFLQALLAAVIASGLTGGGTFVVRNPKKSERKPAKKKG